MLTITIQAKDKQMDLMVLSQQRISEVLKVLKENRLINITLKDVFIYSHRQKEYINQRLTFHQAKIYSGDILEIR